MRVFVLWCAILISDLALAGEKPSGVELFELLLSNHNLSLENEELCKMQDVTHDGGMRTLTLGQLLANNLQIAHESEHTTTIESKCSPEQWEENDKVLDVWDCDVTIAHPSTGASTSNIRFSIPRDGPRRLILGSLRCF